MTSLAFPSTSFAGAAVRCRDDSAHSASYTHMLCSVDTQPEVFENKSDSTELCLYFRRKKFVFYDLTTCRLQDSFAGYTAGLVIERLRVRIPAGAAGEFSSPESTLCADSYSVSVPPPVTAVVLKRPRSFCQKCRRQVTPKQSCIHL